MKKSFLVSLLSNFYLLFCLLLHPTPTRANDVEIENLISEQKYAAALEKVRQSIDSAKAKKKELEWAKLVIKEAHLQMALHGHETAVKDLKKRSWPERPLAETMINLVYAQTLRNYYQSYSWEIRNREKLESKGEVDLKSWTAEQIFQEAYRAFAKIWSERDKLGKYPKNEIPEIITSNSYPVDIRGSLRDSVAYLFVDLLTDSSGWSPVQSNEKYLLDDTKLYSGEKKLNLTDPSIHPLRKISYILTDLGSWHSSAGRTGAALEAKIELIKILHSHLTDKQSRDIGKKILDKAIKDNQKEPWVTMAYATLAEFISQEDFPESKIKAHQTAQLGSQIFPSSPGAARCRDIIKEIERPQFEVNAMNIDGPNRRSVLVNYQNINSIKFRSYPFDIKNFVKNAKDYSIRPSWREIEKSLRGQAAHEWTVKLPPTTDYKMHKHFVTPPVHLPGFYILMAEDEKSKHLTGVQIFFSDLALSVSRDNIYGKLEVHISSGKSGEAIEGVKVSLYKADYHSGHHIAGEMRTDKNGNTAFSVSSTNSMSYFIIAEKGDQMVSSRSPFYMSNHTDKEPRVHGAFIYSDRSIYRPGQKINWKVVGYEGNSKEAKYNVHKNAELAVYLKDANGELIDKKTIKTNNHGTASGEFIVPQGKLLGQWSISSNLGGQNFIRIEEYKRPTFEVEFSDLPSIMRLNHIAKLEGKAVYYFGQPVTTGKTRWSIVRTVILPWWCFWGGWNWGNIQQPQIVDTGESTLSTEGTFQISFTPKGDERLSAEIDGLMYSYRIEVDVTDEGGETRSAAKGLNIGFTSVTANLSLTENFTSAGTSPKLMISRTDLNGVPLKGKGTWRLSVLKTPAETVTPSDIPLPSELKRIAKDELKFPDDYKQNRWSPQYNPEIIMRDWPEEELISEGPLNPEDNSPNLPKLKSGVYRFTYQTYDDFGAKFETSKHIVVVDKDFRLNLPGFFAVQKNSLQVGESIRIFLASGFKDQRLVFEIYKSYNMIERRYIKAHGLIEIPVTEKDRGGMGLTMRLINDYQEIKFSSAIMVPWSNKELNLSFSTFRDKIKPGAKEKWSIHLSGPDKKTINNAHEILAYMYDKSLDSFIPHNPPNPLSIYPARTGFRFPESELGQAPTVYTNTYYHHPQNEFRHMEPDYLKFYPNYGTGGPGARGKHRGGILSASFETNEAMMDAAGAPPSESMAKMSKSNERSEAESGQAIRAEKSAAESTPALRSNFAETAFWKPHLTADTKGNLKIEFEVPDSVTTWNVWVHSITNDLMAGSLKKETRSTKDLLIRPYVPRFFREGDEAELKILVNNSADKDISGELEFDIIDVDTQKSLAASFAIASENLKRSFKTKAGASTSLTYKIKVPPKPGQVAIRAVAKSGNLSDGELRPLPVLPGRFHLAQSKFVTLINKDKREITFEDIEKNDDPTLINNMMIVTLDAQLFYSALSAMPYILNYPYKCTEQVMNSFVTTGILGSVFKKFPAVADMAKEFSSRNTLFENWDDQDPNRKMAMEETPWLALSRGGDVNEKDLVKVLDPIAAARLQKESLKFLEDSQTSSGGFPWFAGGPPSPGMTIYLLYGFSKAIEFGVEVPKPMIQKAWAYMHRHYIQELVREVISKDCCAEVITFLNYVISNYPSAEWTGNLFSEGDKKKMLDFSFKHWKSHSPYMKSYLSLTLQRAKRGPDAKLVWDSVMDSAKFTKDEGTHWAQEDRTWLWYNDTTETHAMALRAGSEIGTKEELLNGIVQWIFLNKKLNHWKSTRATSEVIYSLTNYLSKTDQLAVKENISVKLGGETHTFEFDPKRYTGKKNQIQISSSKITPELLPIHIEKTSPGHAFASATWHYSTEKLPDEDRGDFFKIKRTYFKRIKDKAGHKLLPLDEGNSIEVGDEVEVHLSLKSKHQAEYVHLRDPRSAGFEPVDTNSKHKWDLGIVWYEEIRDSGTNFFFEWLPQGEYTFKYRIRASMAGKFKTSPATIQPLYAPEFVGFSSGKTIEVKEQ